MKIQIKLIAGVLIAAAAPVLVGCGETPQEQPQEVALETTDARLSYGIGLRMGQRMAADGMTVDVPAYAAGLEDALAGGEAMLTDDEINAEMTAFQERRQAEAEAERVALAQTNLEAGRAYMEEMSGREEVQRGGKGD